MKKVCGLGVLLLGGAAAFAHQDSLPDGEGKAVVELACTSRCHGANVVQRARRTPGQWQGMLEVSQKEAAAIVEYRGKHGPFKGWEAAANVPGIDGKVIEERRERLEFH